MSRTTFWNISGIFVTKLCLGTSNDLWTECGKCSSTLRVHCLGTCSASCDQRVMALSHSSPTRYMTSLMVQTSSWAGLIWRKGIYDCIKSIQILTTSTSILNAHNVPCPFWSHSPWNSARNYVWSGPEPGLKPWQGRTPLIQSAEPQISTPLHGLKNSNSLNGS